MAVVEDGREGLDDVVEDGRRHVLHRAGRPAEELGDGHAVALAGEQLDAAELGAVLQTEVGEVGVQVVRAARGRSLPACVGGGPCGQFGRGLLQLGQQGPAGGDPGDGVPPLDGPAGSFDPADDLHLGAAVRPFRQAGADLGGLVLGEDQRFEDVHALQRPARLAVHGVLERQQDLDVARSGEHHLAHDHVVRELGRAVGGDGRGELAHPAFAARGVGDLLTQQRVVDARGVGHQLLGVPDAVDREPVALAVEDRARQRDAAVRAARVVAGPVDVQARGVDVGERLAGRGAGGVLGTGARHPHVVAGVEDAPAQAQQRRGGPDLDEGVASAGADGGHARAEVDRLADVAHPVLGGGQLGRVGHRAGQVGDQGQLGHPEVDRGDDLAERVEHLVHQRRVEGVRDRQRLRPHPAGGERGGDLGERCRAARDHALAGGVERGEGDVLVGLQQRRHLLGGRRHGDHAAGGGHRLHQPGAGGDQPHGVLQREQPADRGGDDLADAVADQDARLDAPAEPELRGGVLQGEQRRLRVAGLVDHLGVLGGAQDEVLHRPADGLREQPVAGVQVLPEDRVRVVQRAAHSRVLGALPGEEQRDLAQVGGGRGGLVQERLQLGAVTDDTGQAGAEVGAADVAGVAEVGEVGVRVLGEEGAVVLRLEGQGLLALGREGEDMPLGPRRVLVGTGLPGGCGRLLQHGGGDGALEAEGVDQCAADRRRPGAALVRHLDGHVRPRDVRRGPVRVQVRVDLAVLQLERGLDDAADAGGGLHVADVALERADDERRVRGVGAGEHPVDGAHLDGVAERGSGAVRLDVGDVAGLQHGRAQRGPHHLLLRGAVGDGQAAALAVLAHRRAADQGDHAVAVAQGVGQPLEDDHAAALGAAVAVGRVVEGLAHPVGREHARLGEDDVVARVVDGVDAAAQRDLALAAPQPLDREVQGDQRRGAGGVDGHARAAHAEEVGDAAGRDAVGGTGADVGVQLVVGQVVDLDGVVDATDADVDAAVAAAQGGRVDVRVLQRLPGGLQYEPLLRVDVLGLLGGDVEEAGVEPVDAVQETAAVRKDLALGVLAAGRELRHVPTGFGDGAGPDTAGAQELGEALGRVVAAREADSGPDDGDGLVLLQHQLLEELLVLLESLTGRLQLILLMGGRVGHGLSSRSGRAARALPERRGQAW